MASRAPIDWDEPIPDQAVLSPAQKPLDETGFGENFGATRDEMLLVGNTNSETTRLHDAYSPLVDALEESGARWDGRNHYLNPGSLPDADTSAYGTSVPGRTRMRQMIFEEIGRRRVVDKGFLAGVPDTPEEFERAANDRNAARLREIRSVQGGASTSGTIGGFAGGVVGSFQDPLILWTMPFGGASKTFVGAVARAAVENAVIEAVSQPMVHQNYEALGEDLTLADSARMVAFSAVAGGAFRGAIEGVRRTGPLYDSAVAGVFNAMPKKLQERWASASTVDDRLLADTLRTTLPEEAWTPDLRAAVNVIERDVEIRDSSPFEPGSVGDAAHAQNLAAALQRIISGTPPMSVKAEALSSAAPAQSRVRPVAESGGPAAVAAELSGMPQPVIAGFLGNFDVEGGYGRAVGDNGTAFGIAQWRHGRVTNFERVIGVHPSRASHAQQARFVRWEMDNPGAAGMTVAQRDAILAARTPEDAARLIDRYYERSSGAHREQRAAAARRHAGTEPARLADAPETPVPRAVDDEVDDLFRAADEVGDTAEEMAVPTLRRDMFSDEESWVRAQADIQQQYRGGVSLERMPDRPPAPLPAEDIGPRLSLTSAQREEVAQSFIDADGVSRAYTVAMSPDEFLGLTSGAKGRAEMAAAVKEKAKYRGGAYSSEEAAGAGPIRLNVDFSDAGNRVTHHAGRHRMTMLKNQGVEQVEVVIYPNGRSATGAIDEAELLPQLGNAKSQLNAGDTPARLYGLTPVSAPSVPQARALAAFDAPDGEGARTLADSLEHDILADLASTPDLAGKRFMIDDNEVTLTDIIAGIEADKAAVAALRGCL